jgi:catechol 2,3-dioxygenase-like lactoylglutathione lyase family enzyme
MGDLRGETIPILPACDIAETIDFYGKLGFGVVNLYDGFGAPYLLLRRDDVELHFVHSPETDPKESDSACYLRLTDA